MFLKFEESANDFQDLLFFHQSCSLMDVYVPMSKNTMKFHKQGYLIVRHAISNYCSEPNFTFLKTTLAIRFVEYKITRYIFPLMCPELASTFLAWLCFLVFVTVFTTFLCCYAHFGSTEGSQYAFRLFLIISFLFRIFVYHHQRGKIRGINKSLNWWGCVYVRPSLSKYELKFIEFFYFFYYSAWRRVCYSHQRVRMTLLHY